LKNTDQFGVERSAGDNVLEELAPNATTAYQKQRNSLHFVFLWFLFFLFFRGLFRGFGGVDIFSPLLFFDFLVFWFFYKFFFYFFFFKKKKKKKKTPNKQTYKTKTYYCDTIKF
jgi:uncharacterized membrane protein